MFCVRRSRKNFLEIIPHPSMHGVLPSIRKKINYSAGLFHSVSRVFARVCESFF
jgi:hypothetical protein